MKALYFLKSFKEIEAAFGSAILLHPIKIALDRVSALNLLPLKHEPSQGYTNSYLFLVIKSNSN